MRAFKFKKLWKKNGPGAQPTKAPGSGKTKAKRRLRITNYFKSLAKDLKRSRWANVSDSGKTFVKVAVFIIIIALALYGIAVGFSTLWSTIGVGADG